MIGIKVEYVQQWLFILKYEKHYRLHFFLIKIFLTYFISYILDSKTKPPIGTVIAIITTICIEKSIKFIHKIWLHWNKRSFIIDDADRFLYAYRWYGCMTMLVTVVFFFCSYDYTLLQLIKLCTWKSNKTVLSSYQQQLRQYKKYGYTYKIEKMDEFSSYMMVKNLCESSCRHISINKN